MLEIRPSETMKVPSLAGRRANLSVDFGALSIRYIFSTETADEEPGDGKLRLNSVIQNIATTIRADVLDQDGLNVSAILDTFDDSTTTVPAGHIRLSKIGNPTRWLIFGVSGMADPGGYRNIAVTPVSASSANPFADGDSILLTFTRTGNQGAKGDPGDEVSFDTVNAIQNADIDEGVNAIRTGGYAVAGDGGGALYVRSEETSVLDERYVESSDGAIWELAETVLRPQMLGIDDTGSSNMHALITLLVNDGRPVYWPAGRYRVDDNVIVTIAPKWDLHPDALIFSTHGSSTAWTFEVNGEFGHRADVTSGGAKGTKAVTVSTADAAHFEAGDLVIVGSNDRYNPNSTNVKSTEINYVQEVNPSTGVITLRIALQDNYTTEPFIEKEHFLEGTRIRGGAIQGPPEATGRGIRLLLNRDFDIDIRTIDCNGTHIALVDSCEGRVTPRCLRTPGPGVGYGVSASAATQDVVISGGYMTDCRHAFTITTPEDHVGPGGTANRRGVGRRITVDSCTIIISSAGHALDTHSAGEEIVFSNNTIIQAGGAGTGTAINLECRSGKAHGNTIVNPSNTGITFVNQTGRIGYVSICDNTILRPGNRGIAVTVSATTGDPTYESIVISGNLIEDSADLGIRVVAVNAAAMFGLSVTGNRVLRAGPPVPSVHQGRAAMHIADVHHGTVSGNTLDTIAAEARCMFVERAVGLAIGTNTLTKLPTSTSGYLDLVACDRCAVNGNVCMPISGEGGGLGIRLGANTTNSTAIGNILVGTGGLNDVSGTNETAHNVT